MKGKLRVNIGKYAVILFFYLSSAAFGDEISVRITIGTSEYNSMDYGSISSRASAAVIDTLNYDYDPYARSRKIWTLLGLLLGSSLVGALAAYYIRKIRIESVINTVSAPVAETEREYTNPSAPAPSVENLKKELAKMKSGLDSL